MQYRINKIATFSNITPENNREHLITKFAIIYFIAVIVNIFCWCNFLVSILISFFMDDIFIIYIINILVVTCKPESLL